VVPGGDALRYPDPCQRFCGSGAKGDNPAVVTKLVTFLPGGDMQDQRVSVGRLKARLSEFLKRASAGMPVLITSRGRPIARLVPLNGPEAHEGRLSQLLGAGLVRPPRAPLHPSMLSEPGPPDPGARSLECILEERGEGW
jgi:prevent-host-death family protein